MYQLTRQDMRLYQNRAAKWIRRRLNSMLIVDMGLGKTVSTLTAISDLLMMGELSGPVLVVGPGRVVRTVWRQEALKWEHTQHLTFSLVGGEPHQRVRALAKPADIYLLSIDNFVWLVQRMGLEPPKKRGKRTLPTTAQMIALPKPPPEVDLDLADRFGMWVVDESSKFKDPTTQRFKYAEALTPKILYRVPLTGTPTPNKLLEIWSQAFVADAGKRLGPSYNRFRERFFYTDDYGGFNWVPRPGALEYVYKMLGDIALRLDGADWLALPPVIDNIVKVELPPEARALYRDMERKMLIELENGAVVEAVNAAIVSMKCHQLANGAIYDNEEDRTSWAFIHDAKIEALEDILDEAGESPVLVVYGFKHDLARLKVAYPDAPVFSEARDVEGLVEEWNARKHRVMLIHAASAGHGLNLQFGGNRLVFFCLTWSRENHDQVFERIGPARQIGLVDNVIRHYIVAQDTVDEDIMDTIFVKGAGQKQFLDALRDNAKRRQNLLETTA
jgi:SNF2 family DNA or RNA helicase